MSKKETVKNESTVKYSNIPETPQDHARKTREMMRRKGITSPDTSKMLTIKRGKAVYCFYPHNKERYERMKRKFEEEDEKEEQRKKFYQSMSLSEPVSQTYLTKKDLRCRDCKKIYRYGKTHFRCSDPRNDTSHGNKQVMLKTNACIYIEEV